MSAPYAPDDYSNEAIAWRRAEATAEANALVAEMKAAGYTVSVSETIHHGRCHVSRKHGSTLVYGETTTASSGRNVAIQGAYRKWIAHRELVTP